MEERFGVAASAMSLLIWPMGFVLHCDGIHKAKRGVGEIGEDLVERS